MIGGYRMFKQEFLRESDLIVTVKPVDYDEVMSRKPKRITKTYQKAATFQISFVDYTIEILRRNAMGKVTETGEAVKEVEAEFPLIFPQNADVLPVTLEYIKVMKLELIEKCINGERATYLLRGKIRLND